MTKSRLILSLLNVFILYFHIYFDICILLLTFIYTFTFIVTFFINYLIIINTHITKSNKCDIHNPLNILLYIKLLNIYLIS